MKEMDLNSLIKKSDITISKETKAILEGVFNTNDNLYITGKAGTGKSTLLNFIHKNYPKDIAVLAPTGIAALNIGGDTIHSFFKLKPGYEFDEASNARFSSILTKKLNILHSILIDEISMVRADILDAIDVLLRRTRKNDIPFGGVRMLFFGDLFQLPPTLNKLDEKWFYGKYSSPYFFSAHVFRQKDLFTPPYQLKKNELTKVYRQSNTEFIEALNELRNGSLSQKNLNLLNSRVGFELTKDSPYIHLVTTNRMANSINTQKLNKIQNPTITYNAFIQGKIGKIQPNELTISVKVGAQVMFINNDIEKRWVNGTIGTIISQSKKISEENNEPYNVIVVQLEDGKEIEVIPYTWEISQYVFKGGRFRRENLGYFTQIPLKLAWAVTIHKSQGKSFNSVILDLGSGSFAHGQTYVALSRCRNMEGLILQREITREDIIVDPIILDWYK